MFSKHSSSVYHPPSPLLIWDGACPFCAYWVARWKRITGEKVKYVPYQVIHRDVPDIPESDFRQAARLIDTRGNVYNGPEAAYWCLKYGTRWRKLFHWYRSSDVFRYVSDKMYVFIANHRSFLYKITKLFWGKDPENPRHYWAYYMSAVLGAIAFLTAVLVLLL